MELHIYTVGTYIMYYLDCKAVRVKIIVYERSCLEARVNDTSDLTSNLPSTHVMLLYYPDI